MRDEHMTSDQIREAFLSYFESQNHLRVASSSLIPVGDPTLLLTIAGMNQFKPYYSGLQEPPNQRLTSAQKCFRTPDIDIVGDATHNTLFEMLGNFSIGDYFKQDAIKYAIEFLTLKLQLPLEKFSITIHHSDHEAGDIWESHGVPKTRIFKFGDSDNWWGPPIHGTEGPCGPCSELHYDFGQIRGCQQKDCGPNCENIMSTGEVCNRFVELWNLVFMQFYHHPDGQRDLLPAPSIDTGMGLERATIIMQDALTMYETDIFEDLIQQVQKLSGVKYNLDLETDYAIRAVAEHVRSSTFLTADGVIPGNEGRGYVLRRVIRRAIRLGRKIGMSDHFMSNLAVVVIEKMKGTYPELNHHREFILSVLELEEERFQRAFENGYSILQNSMSDASKISGDLAFQLWDTHGFPVEVTKEIAAESNVSIDMNGFEKAMEDQRTRARSNSQFDNTQSKIKVYESLGVPSSNFVGYDTLETESVVVGIIKGNQPVEKVTKEDEVEIVLQETSFYAEGGGQVGDHGIIVSQSGIVQIDDTRESIPGLNVHYGKVTSGSITIGESVSAKVDPIVRENTARNHTATHMLHAALREILGTHVRQAGSLVTGDRLRFDFSHIKAVTEEELWKVQNLVNEKIRNNARIIRSEDTYSSAIEKGALAFFGDKYGETVRMVEIVNGGRFSFEVCGGTHVEHTGEVGIIHILGESSIGAGMRRIEAVSGRAAEKLIWDRFRSEKKLTSMLQTTETELESKISGLLIELDSAQKRAQGLEQKLAIQSAESLIDVPKTVNGIRIVCNVVNVESTELLRSTADWIRDKIGSGVIGIGSTINGNPMIIITVSEDVVEMGVSASELVKPISEIIKGGGGGRPSSAQAGGKDSSKLPIAIETIPNFIKNLTKN